MHERPAPAPRPRPPAIGHPLPTPTPTPPPPPPAYPPPATNPYAQPGPAPAPPGNYGYYASAASPAVDPLGRPLAEWWKRLVAYLIDGLVVGIPLIILWFVLLIPSMANTTTDPQTGAITSGGGLVAGSILLGVLISLAASVAYSTILNGGPSGQTFGKKALKIQVRDASNGGPIGYGRAFIRYFVPALIGSVCGLFQLLDGLWPLWDEKRQALHDKIANSLVVDVE